MSSRCRWPPGRHASSAGFPRCNGPRPLDKTGNGTLFLFGVGGYTGPTNILAGELVGSAPSALASASDFTVASGARLRVAAGLGSIPQIGSLAGAGGLISATARRSALAATASTRHSRV